MGLLVSVFSFIVDRIFKFGTEEDPSEKFKVEDGITLFDCPSSPCAQRVRIALLEKGIPWKKVDVNLLIGEQYHEEFLKINPNHRVPAIAFKNVNGIPDGFMFESNVIIEFLDAVFPSPKLYPEDPWERAQAQMWQDWELSLVDDHTPFVIGNTLPFVIRMMFPSKENFLKSLNPDVPESMRIHSERLYDGKFKTREELEKHAIASYQNLLVLEKALEGKTYLVGDHFSIADLSIIPRVSMFQLVGLSYTSKHFPNVCRYWDNLAKRTSISGSKNRLQTFFEIYFQFLMVAVGNWKSGVKHIRFDGSQLIERAIGEALITKNTLSLGEQSQDTGSDEVLVYDYSTLAECWQVKLLLQEKGMAYRCIDRHVVDLIGRSAGSGGLLRIEHGDRMITGARTVLEYIDRTFPGLELLPKDPTLKAEVQCWQAWEQTMYVVELSPLVEMDIVSKLLVFRYHDRVDELLSLRSSPQHHAKISNIIECFMAGLPPHSPCWEDIRAQCGSQTEMDIQSRKKKKEFLIMALHTRLQHLEHSLQGKKFLVGDHLTLADVCVFCRLAFFTYVGMKISASKYPSVSTWMVTLQARPHFQNTIDTIAKIMQPFFHDK